MCTYDETDIVTEQCFSNFNSKSNINFVYCSPTIPSLHDLLGCMSSVVSYLKKTHLKKIEESKESASIRVHSHASVGLCLQDARVLIQHYLKQETQSQAHSSNLLQELERDLLLDTSVCAGEKAKEDGFEALLNIVAHTNVPQGNDEGLKEWEVVMGWCLTKLQENGREMSASSITQFTSWMKKCMEKMSYHFLEKSARTHIWLQFLANLYHRNDSCMVRDDVNELFALLVDSSPKLCAKSFQKSARILNNTNKVERSSRMAVMFQEMVFESR